MALLSITSLIYFGTNQLWFLWDHSLHQFLSFTGFEHFLFNSCNHNYNTILVVAHLSLSVILEATHNPSKHLCIRTWLLIANWIWKLKGNLPIRPESNQEFQKSTLLVPEWMFYQDGNHENNLSNGLEIRESYMPFKFYGLYVVCFTFISSFKLPSSLVFPYNGSSSSLCMDIEV